MTIYAAFQPISTASFPSISPVIICLLQELSPAVNIPDKCFNEGLSLVSSVIQLISYPMFVAVAGTFDVIYRCSYTYI